MYALIASLQNRSFFCKTNLKTTRACGVYDLKETAIKKGRKVKEVCRPFIRF